MPGLLEEMSTMASSLTKDENNDKNNTTTAAPTKLPKGVVLDKDGKPCRTCTSTSAWLSMMKTSTKSKPSSSSTSDPTTSLPPSATAETTPNQPPNCPPDVEELGRSTWTLLHAMTATYPTQPTPIHQQKTKSFLSLFSQFYPCWVCAEDFQTWIAQPENEPAVTTQEDFGRWMCRAHNEVNRKLGKEEFDCNLWRERWKDGWKDGRCG